jgi:hypothetical protein
MSATNSGFTNHAAGARPFQFGLRELLRVTTVVCVSAATWRVVGWPAWIVPLTALMIAIAASDGDGQERRRRARWGVILGASVFAHAVVAGYATETLGWIPSFFAHAALLLYWPAAVLYLMGKCRAGADWGLALALGLVTPQAIWAVRLAGLKDEVAAIRNFAEDERQRSGNYPKDLQDYEWRAPSLQSYIEYGGGREDELLIYFRPTSMAEPHWYSSRSGYGYDPD